MAKEKGPRRGGKKPTGKTAGRSKAKSSSAKKVKPAPAKKVSKIAAGSPRRAAKATAASGGFATGARVRITIDSADVKKGSLGTVTQPLMTAQACFVRFDGRSADLLVLNSDLEPA